MIYKMFDGRYIDLSKVVEVGELVPSASDGEPLFFEIVLSGAGARCVKRAKADDDEEIYKRAIRSLEKSGETKGLRASQKITNIHDRVAQDRTKHIQMLGQQLAQAYAELLRTWLLQFEDEETIEQLIARLS
jgi:hypothetical protein